MPRLRSASTFSADSNESDGDPARGLAPWSDSLHGELLHPSTGLAVRIAGLGRCGDVRNVVLEVLPGGVLRLNAENQKRDELGHRLQGVFKTRAYRYVFVTGDPNVSLEKLPTRVDFVALLTPSVLRKATYREDGTRLDLNPPADYIVHPPRL